MESTSHSFKDNAHDALGNRHLQSALDKKIGRAHV